MNFSGSFQNTGSWIESEWYKKWEESASKRNDIGSFDGYWYYDPIEKIYKYLPSL
jgi:hypothetical protein